MNFLKFLTLRGPVSSFVEDIFSISLLFPMLPPLFLFFLIDLFSVVGGLFRCLKALIGNKMVALRSVELSFAAYLGWQVLSVA